MNNLCLRNAVITLKILLVTLIFFSSFATSSASECNQAVMQKMIPVSGRMPSVQVIDSTFNCVGVTRYLSSLDRLDRDILFMYASKNSFEEYQQFTTKTEKPVAYGDLMPEEKLKQLWLWINRLYEKVNSASCLMRKYALIKDYRGYFRFITKVKFLDGQQVLALDNVKIPIREFNPALTQINESYNQVRDDDCPTTFCKFSYDINFYKAKATSGKPDMTARVSLSIPVAKPRMGRTSYKRARQTLKDMFIDWPRQCKGSNN